MSLGRRKARLDDPAAWVFNRMADAYAARPDYPPQLIAALSRLAGPGGWVTELGAGIGHLALPLARLGHAVTAVEPAERMLCGLRHRAKQAAVELCALHATAEAVPRPNQSADLVLIADALHFLDAELTGREVARLLRSGGSLALVTCHLADTPFMRALTQALQTAAPRRPRRTDQTKAQLFAVAGLSPAPPETFRDESVVSPEQLDRILDSISFIGPAMNEGRRADLRREVRKLSPEPVWARDFTLMCGRRTAR